jgi:hypothetical protein
MSTRCAARGFVSSGKREAVAEGENAVEKAGQETDVQKMLNEFKASSMFEPIEKIHDGY